MPNLVFSLDKFREYCTKTGLTPYEIDHSIYMWAGSCEGLSREELRKNGILVSQAWLKELNPVKVKLIDLIYAKLVEEELE